MASRKDVELNKIANIPDTLKCIKRDHEESVNFIKFEFKCDICDSITAKSIRGSEKQVIEVICEHCELQNNINDKINELKSFGWETINTDLSLKSKNEYKCVDCGNIAKAKQDFHTKLKTLRNREGTNGCMFCHISAGVSERLDKHTPLLKQMEDFGFTIIDKSNYSKMILKCNNCNHEFNKSLYKFESTLGLSCPECNSGNKLRTGIEPNLPKPDFKNTNRYQQLKDIIKTKNVTILNEDNVDHVRCECNECKHIFYKSLENIARSQNSCPKCYKQTMSKRKLQQSQHPIMERINNSNIRLVGPYIGIKKHQDVKCVICDTIFQATPIAVLSAYEQNPNSSHCPTCNKHKRIEKTHATGLNYIDLAKSKGYRILTECPYTRRGKVEVINPKCGHQFETELHYIANGNVECSICGREELSKITIVRNIQKSLEWQETAPECKIFKSEVDKFTNQTYNKCKELINPNDLPRGLAGVPDVYQLDHILSKKFCYTYGLSAEFCGSLDNLQMLSNTENNTKSARFLLNTPKTLMQYVPSIALKDLFNDELGIYGTVKQNATYFKHLDFYVYLLLHDDIMDEDVIPEVSKLTPNSYIFLEDEWRNNAPLIYDKIIHKLHKGNKSKIGARKCTIKYVDYSVIKDFTNVNHLQGSVSGPSAKYLGAYYDNELVAMMSFCTPRNKGLQNKYINKNSYELLRFCTDTTYTLPGIASKMLAFFKNTNDWDVIYSYADKRFSNGNLYNKLGFNKIEDTDKGYFYIKDGVKYNRTQFQKSKLSEKLEYFDESLSEVANMLNNGYTKVYDLGQHVFEMVK